MFSEGHLFGDPRCVLNVECRGSEKHGALFVVVLVHDNAEMPGSLSCGSNILLIWLHATTLAWWLKSRCVIYKSCAEALQCMFSGAVSLLCGSGVQDMVRGFPPEGHITWDFASLAMNCAKVGAGQWRDSSEGTRVTFLHKDTLLSQV